MVGIVVINIFDKTQNQQFRCAKEELSLDCAKQNGQNFTHKISFALIRESQNKQGAEVVGSKDMWVFLIYTRLFRRLSSNYAIIYHLF